MVPRYTSTDQLLASYMTKGESGLMSARRRALMVVQAGLLDVPCGLYVLGGDELYISTTGGCYLLPSRSCPYRTG